MTDNELSDAQALAIMNKLVLQMTGSEARALIDLIMTEAVQIGREEGKSDFRVRTHEIQPLNCSSSPFSLRAPATK